MTGRAEPSAVAFRATVCGLSFGEGMATGLEGLPADGAGASLAGAMLFALGLRGWEGVLLGSGLIRFPGSLFWDALSAALSSPSAVLICSWLALIVPAAGCIPKGKVILCRTET